MYFWPGILNCTRSALATNKGVVDPHEHQQNLRKLETSKEKQMGWHRSEKSKLYPLDIFKVCNLLAFL